MSLVNYEEEQKRLDNFKPEDASQFWKATPGQHKVKALSEIEDAEPYEEKEQAKMSILVGEEPKVWTFAVGKSSASTYGQLVALATKHKGTLKNIDFTVVVVSDGNKNSYTIVS